LKERSFKKRAPSELESVDNLNFASSSSAVCALEFNNSPSADSNSNPARECFHNPDVRVTYSKSAKAIREYPRTRVLPNPIRQNWNNLEEFQN
jgi:hypothetical protein